MMPFVTEELYAAVKAFAGESAPFLLTGGYQTLDYDWSNVEAEKEMARVMAAVSSIRSLRSQLNVPPGLKLKAAATGPFAEAVLGKHRAYVSSLARLESIEPATGGLPPQNATAVADGVTFYVPLAGVVDFAKERERLAKDLAKAVSDIEKCEAKLRNLATAPNVPAEKLDEARAQRDGAAARREQLTNTLAALA